MHTCTVTPQLNIIFNLHKFLLTGANLKKIVETYLALLYYIRLYYIIFSFALTLVLIFLLYISKHTFVIFPVHETKKLNYIEFREIPTYIKFNLRKVPWNATLT